MVLPWRVAQENACMDRTVPEKRVAILRIAVLMRPAVMEFANLSAVTAILALPLSPFQQWAGSYFSLVSVAAFTLHAEVEETLDEL